MQISVTTVLGTILSFTFVFKLKKELQLERVGGFKDFIEDVYNKRFPAREHVIKAPDNLIEEFLTCLND